MMKNDYIPFPSKILEVIRHTKIEYTFRMEFQGDVKPGQFLKCRFLNMEKLLYQSVVLETTS